LILDGGHQFLDVEEIAVGEGEHIQVFLQLGPRISQDPGFRPGGPLRIGSAIGKLPSSTWIDWVVALSISTAWSLALTLMTKILDSRWKGNNYEEFKWRKAVYARGKRDHKRVYP
jgi:hypothetical protein